MAAAVSPVPPPPPAGEQRILLNGITWKDYVLLRDVLDGPGVRLTYLRGVLELMSPSLEHELWKTNIARLVELYAHVRRIDLHGYGSTTFKREAKQRGAEPDECYLIGKKLADWPEIVLEVIPTSPLIDKLDVYAGMGIGEVWVFRDGRFTIHVLDRARSRYDARPCSPLLPGLDFETVARLAVRSRSACGVSSPLRVRALAWHHRDPFDRLLVAHALEEQYTIVTHDDAFAAYGVAVMKA